MRTKLEKLNYESALNELYTSKPPDRKNMNQLIEYLNVDETPACDPQDEMVDRYE